MRPFIECISSNTQSYVICYPNAGKLQLLRRPCNVGNVYT